MADIVGDPTQRHVAITEITDSDAQRSLTYDVPIQELADMIWRMLRDQAGSGTLATMLALTGSVAGDRYCLQGYGDYVFVAGTTTIKSPLAFNSSGTPSGHWLHENAYALMCIDPATGSGAIAGICRIGSCLGSDTTPDNRVPPENVPNRIVASGYGSGAGQLSETLTASTDGSFPNYSITIANAVVGDIIDGVYGPVAIKNNSGGIAAVSIFGHDSYGDEPIFVERQHMEVLGSSTFQGCIPFHHVVQKSGTTRVYLYGAAASGGTLVLYGLDAEEYHTGNYQQVRP
jgi:hypothetical protein